MTRAVLGACALLAALAIPAAAQTRVGPASLPEAAPHRFEIEDPSALVAATTLLIASGTADDPAGLEGLTWTVVDAIARALRLMPGVLQVDASATRGTVRFTLITTPEATEQADEALHSTSALIRGLPAALEAARTRFVFTAETPAAEVELEAARLFAGFGTAWTRPPRGTAASVEAITSAAATARWQSLLDDAEWHEVRVGPAAALVDAAPSSALPAAGRRAAGSGLAWASEDRVRIVREVTNIWIVAGFPIPADLSRTSLDHLVHRIEEIIDPVPGDAGLIAAGVDVARIPTGDVLVVRATVLPGAARRWEERIRTLPADITPPFDPDFFRWERRRFRAHLLLGDADPTRRSQRLANDLWQTGGFRSLAEEAWALEPDDLANAAARLGPPRVLVFGPDRGDPQGN